MLDQSGFPLHHPQAWQRGILMQTVVTGKRRGAGRLRWWESSVWPPPCIGSAYHLTSTITPHNRWVYVMVPPNSCVEFETDMRTWQQGTQKQTLAAASTSAGVQSSPTSKWCSGNIFAKTKTTKFPELFQFPLQMLRQEHFLPFWNLWQQLYTNMGHTICGWDGSYH